MFTNVRMNWRLASRLSVITLAVLVVVVVLVIQQQKAGMAQALQGTDLQKRASSGFTLTDQYGKKVSLSQWQGKPVVLTFLFTNCPDVCPLTAEHLHQVMEQLGPDATKVGILAVSTDPKRDNVAAALNFSRAHRMESYWHFLVGTKDELAPIWQNYGMFAQNLDDKVTHSSGIFFIDKLGRQRVFLGDDFQPAQVTQNLQILLKE